MSKPDRKELINNYKNSPPDAGVYKIINRKTERFILASTMDINGMNNRFQFAKRMDSKDALPLVSREDIKEYGIENFDFEILERIAIKPEMSKEECQAEMDFCLALWQEKLDSLMPNN